MDVSFQLYSAREFTPWEDVLKMIAGLGYTQVEGFGGVYGDPVAFKAALDQNGLTMPSGHFFPIGSFEEGLESSLNAAKVLKMQRLFCPAPEDLWRNGTDAANWIALAKRLEEAAKKVNDAGFAFGWHNHHWEFMPLPGGEIAMELLLEHAPSIDWEMDVAWVVRGGADPLAYIERYSDRLTTAHVKDIAPAGDCVDEDGWADVGHGTLDWKGIMAALRGAGVDLFVMEHDKPSDAQRFASRSIEAFKGL
ncbi:sugar phosphate isomerase/epimerase family protein [Sagittula sp. S175]|uniref:sugar phosphate isomerase/epimerase family protein n=1 Tax=Sagittula sp. S175 TaxID=3415129 RepID=UPI003C7CF9B8